MMFYSKTGVKLRGFTLIELLVVIAIIAMLLAILMPALGKVKAMGQRIVCISNLHQLGVANEMYSNNYTGQYCPVRDDTKWVSGAPGFSPAWVSNMEFRNLVGMNNSDNNEDFDDDILTILPDEYFCPSDELAQQGIDNGYDTMCSYGYNITDWMDQVQWGSPTGFLVAAHKAPSITRPGHKLMFIDSNDWWAQWASADYVVGWDVFGQSPSIDYNTIGFGGPTLYRHAEGANIAFYDGHASYLKKDRIWIEEDYWDVPKRPEMWLGDLSLYHW